jgi:molybdopterin synthase sulfur carrier subunit
MARSPGVGPDAVTVRYWAAARAAAGRDHDRVPAGPLAGVLDAVLELHADQPRFAIVLSVCSVLVGEDPVGGRDRERIEVPPGSFVELLPPFAGG